MSNSVSVYIEYYVKKSVVYQYEKQMENVLDLLTELGAANLQWYVSPKADNLYVEQFHLPTEAYFHALKKLRVSNENHIIKELNQYIEGGVESITFLACKKCS